MFKEFVRKSLAWFPEKGVGYFPVESDVYDASYFEKYCHYAVTEMGAELTKARALLVERYYSGQVLDVGIGSGQFVESMPGAFGYDVNPAAVKWLVDRGAYKDPYAGGLFECMTFWDSLEHIDDPSKILRAVTKWVFVSMPIFTDLEHLLSSKHYRKDEHFWYFTLRGLVNWFRDQGFESLECNDAETKIGRQDIKSFVFKRSDDDG